VAKVPRNCKWVVSQPHASIRQAHPKLNVSEATQAFIERALHFAEQRSLDAHIRSAEMRRVNHARISNCVERKERPAGL
jgi:hypothetical protein